MRIALTTFVSLSFVVLASGCPRELPSLPFAAGSDVYVIQGWNGTQTHQDHMYYALDFAGTVGTHILAASDGTVVFTYNECSEGEPFCNNDWGKAVVINHGYGEWTNYAHLESVAPNIAVGMQVCRGQFIGTLGNTGGSSSPHLHFQMQDSGEVSGNSIAFDGFEECDIPEAGDTVTSQNKEITSCD